MFSLKKMLYMVLIAGAFEIILFNLSHWESFFFDKNATYELHISEGVELVENDVYKVVDPDNAYIELLNINAKVSNLYVNFFPEWQPIKDYAVMKIELSATDAANSDYLILPETEIVNGTSNSLYKRLHLIGESNRIKVKFLDCYDWIIRINKDSILINVEVPFRFSPIRFVIVCLLLCIIYLFRPSSKIFFTNIDIKSAKQQLLIIAAVMLNLLIYFFISYNFRDDNWKNTTWTADLQYNYVAESLLNGHVWLDFEPPSVLNDMENPYDSNLRGKLLGEAGESYITDFAWYNGRYYSCFGIIPVLLFYLPKYIITGSHLYSGTLILVFSLLYILAVFWFLFIVASIYYKNLSLGVYLLISTAFCASTGMLYCIQMPGIYTTPIALSLFFTIFGITCWFKSKCEEDKIKRIFLVIGSLSIAMTMGCRVQFILVLSFAFVIFKDQIINGLFFRFQKASIINTICVIVPFFMIGIIVMWYNYARFGNVFDFGAKYNLTGFDMTNRGFLFSRFFLGWAHYLFQPPMINTKFPFISIVAGHMSISHDYMGQVINEPMIGGYLFFNPLLFFVFLNKKKDKLFPLAIASLFVGFVILCVDIQMVGMTLRYISDFSVFLMIAASIAILSYFEKINKNDNLQIFILKMFVLLSFICIVMNYYGLFAAGRYNDIKYASPGVYYGLKYLI